MYFDKKQTQISVCHNATNKYLHNNSACLLFKFVLIFVLKNICKTLCRRVNGNCDTLRWKILFLPKALPCFYFFSIG